MLRGRAYSGSSALSQPEWQAQPGTAPTMYEAQAGAALLLVDVVAHAAGYAMDVVGTRDASAPC